MAALTWRNVDGPDFRTSLDGIRTFGNLFGDAFQGLNQGIDKFERFQDQRANNAALMGLLQYQDPEKYKAALASGTVFAGIDPNRLNAGTIQAAAGRTNDLLNQATNEFNLNKGKTEFDRTQGIWKAQDTAAADAAGLLSAASKGPEAEAAWRAAHPDFGKGLTLNDTVGLFKDAQSARTNFLGNTRTEVGIEGDRTRNAQAAFDFQNSKEDRADLMKVQDVVGKMAGEVTSAGDFDRVAGKYGLTGRQSLLARQMLASSVPGLDLGASGAVGSGGGGFGGSGDPTRVITGGATVPPNVQTMGQAVQFGKSLNRAGQASSAMGVYQITQSTMEEFGAKALGADWQNKPFDFNSQDKVAEQIFNSVKGNPEALRKRWVSLSPSEAAAVAKMPWAQAREIIAKGESGASPQALAAGASLAAGGARNMFAQTNVNGLADEAFAKAQMDTRPAVAIAAELTGKGGVFEGTDQGRMLSNIQDVQSRARAKGISVSAAQAAQILQNSTTQRTWNDYLFGNWSSTNINKGLTSGLSIDNKTVDSQIDQIKSGANQRTAFSNDQLKQGQDAIAQAQQAAAAAQARYAALVQAKAGPRPNLDPSIIAEAAQQARQAAALADTTIKAQTGSIAAAGPNGRFFGQPTPVKPAPVARGPAPAMKSTISDADWAKMVAARDAAAKPAPQRQAATGRKPLPFEEWNNVPASLRR